MKQAYISPHIKPLKLVTHDNISEFVVTSHSVGENEGLAKENNFSFDDEADNDNTSENK